MLQHDTCRCFFLLLVSLRFWDTLSNFSQTTQDGSGFFPLEETGSKVKHHREADVLRACDHQGGCRWRCHENAVFRAKEDLLCVNQPLVLNANTPLSLLRCCTSDMLHLGHYVKVKK